jgi:putative DNA primase/helicase
MNKQIGKKKLAKTWKKKMPKATAPNYPRNDMERAVRFAKRFAGELKYVYAWKKWLRWDAVRWVPDEDGAVYRKAEEMPKLFLQEASKINDVDRRKKAAAAAIQAGNRTRIEAMINHAQCQPGIVASPTLFDSDPLLLGVSNDVVDLRTGTFREASKEDYIIKHRHDL